MPVNLFCLKSTKIKWDRKNLQYKLQTVTEYESIIPGGGEMGALIRDYDWSSTPIGAIESWSPSLRTTVSNLLGSRFPMFIWWGKGEYINIYNDAYIPILGVRHPDGLGQSADEVWADVWDAVRLQVESVFVEGKSFGDEASLFIVERNGYPEEAYFTFSYSSVFEADGSVGGAFCTLTEETYRVVSDRRIQTLRKLAEAILQTKTVRDAVTQAIDSLSNNSQDITFALLYLLDETKTKAQLIASTRLEGGTAVNPREIELEHNADDLWLLQTVLESGKIKLVQLDELKYGQLPSGAWSEPSKLAAVLPIDSSEQTASGCLIVGINPFRPFNDDYQGFLNLVAGQIATAIANARAYEAEKQRAEALAEIDRAKTEFFSNVSHEFRTPLSLMLSPLEDALADPHEPLPPSQQQRIELVQRNGIRLLKLVNTLLDFSRIEAGRIQAQYQPTDLATLTAELASVFRSAIKRAGLEFVVDCPTLPEAVYVDRDLWEKIVFNLISNAFKFTLSGSIAVRLRWQKTEVELSVKDTGIGIPPAELPNLFKRFHRVQGSRGRSFEGSGIGLSFVKELVELHQGSIKVFSILDKGSRFTVTVPTGSTHLPSDRILDNPTELDLNSENANSYLKQALGWLQNPVTPLIEREFTVEQPTPNLRKSSARILLVDDNQDMRDYLARLLDSCYEVETVADSMAALNAVQNNPPDLILSDVMMPGMDGFELLRSLREQPQTQEIPIILLSARAGEESRIEGLEAGADDYLIKPFSARELLARIEATLKLAELRRTARTLRQQTETAEANLQNVLSSLRDGFLTLDRDWCYTYINDRQLEIISKKREEVIGKNVWHIFPDIVDTEFYDRAEQVMLSRIPLQFEYYYPTWERWFENRIYPVPNGIAILCAEITERKQIEGEREQLLVREKNARSKAEELNRLKDEFLAIVSHELRTPLNPIIGWSELLAAGRLNSEQTAQAIDIVRRNAKLQAQLIEDLLDVSRILRGKIKLDLVSINLAAVIKAAISTVELTADAKSIELITDLDPDLGSVLGDFRRLQQIIWNLLSNAIKFTPEGGRVTVKLRKVEQNASIEVADTGEGIEPEFLPYVFDRFRQQDSASTRNFGGLGLGLAIVRHLTELHRGSISVSSPGEGQGATFTLLLPLEPIANTTPFEAEPSDNTVEPKQLAGIRVLAVDDEIDSLDLLASILSQQGSEVTTVTSAKAAMSALTQSNFDLLISDISMPEVNGYELIRQIRNLESPLADIPAIALTAYASEGDRQRSIDVGYQKHIGKPINISELLTIIEQLIQ